MDVEKRGLRAVYIVYAGIGLPFGILGSAWPTVRADLSLPLEYIGVLNAIMLIGAMIGCGVSSHLQRRVHFGKLLPFAFSLMSLCVILLSLTGSGLYLACMLLPYGIAEGVTDGCCNQYVARLCPPRSLAFLHFSNGLGLLIGPLVVASVISLADWKAGWLAIGLLCCCCAAPALLTQAGRRWPDLRGAMSEEASPSDQGASNSLPRIGVALTLFFMNTGVLSVMTGLLSSYFHDLIGASLFFSGVMVTIFFASMTLSRLLSGFLTTALGSRRILRVSFALIAAGCLVASCARAAPGAVVGAVAVGMGMGPLTPCLVHETDRRFSGQAKKDMIGYQLAAAQLGGALLPLLAAFLSARLGLGILFPFVFTQAACMFVGNEYMVYGKL
jgi:MFS family permease